MNKDDKDHEAFLDMYDRREQGERWKQRAIARAEKQWVAKQRRQHSRPMMDQLIGGMARQQQRMDEAEALLKASAIGDITDTLTDRRHTRQPERNAAFQRLVDLCGQAEAVRLIKSAAGKTTDDE